MWMNLLFCLLIIYPSSEAKPQRVKRATSAERQLIRASKDNDIGEVRDLLNQRTDVDAADSDQWTALHWAGKSFSKHFLEENFVYTSCSKNVY